MKSYRTPIALLALFAFVALLTVFISTGHLDNKNFVYLFATAAICLRYLRDRKNFVSDPDSVPKKRGVLYKIAVTLFFVVTLPILALMIFAPLSSKYNPSLAQKSETKTHLTSPQVKQP